eukprot:3179022-Rhodomonas_salina.1
MFVPANRDTMILPSHFGSVVGANTTTAHPPAFFNTSNPNPMGISVHTPSFAPGLNSATQSASSTQPASPTAAEQPEKKESGSKGRKDRRKQQGERLVYTRDSLQHLFTLPLCEAAARLNMSARSLASVCRKLGIKKWPYKPPHYR